MKRAYFGLGTLLLTVGVTAGLISVGPINHLEEMENLSAELAGGRAPTICTFSIVAYDPDRQEWGVAVASKFLAVGAVVPWAKAGVGAIATQSHANTTFGRKGLDLLAQGKSAEEVDKILTEADPGTDVRQVGIV